MPNCPATGQGVATMVESDQPVAATRQMTWENPVYGSTLESGISGTSRTWYFGEGATNDFSVFYLLQNPGDTPATVTLTLLARRRRGPDFARRCRAPLCAAHRPRERRAGTVACRVRDHRHLGRADRRRAGDVPEHDEPPVGGGTAGRGSPVLSTSWSFAEGATGFFSAYVLLGIPPPAKPPSRCSYHLPDGTTITRSVRRPAAVATQCGTSTWRFQSWHPRMAMAMTITSTLPIVAERAMWWGPFPWTEGTAGIGTPSDRHDVGHR